jgi:outer membrane protein TolC
MKRIGIATVLLLAMVLCNPAWPASITMFQAVEAGLKNNQLLQAATMNTIAQKEEYLAQRGTLFPSLWLFIWMMRNYMNF